MSSRVKESNLCEQQLACTLVRARRRDRRAVDPVIGQVQQPADKGLIGGDPGRLARRAVGRRAFETVYKRE